MNIANYFASIGFKVDRKSFRRVDSDLKKIERKLKLFAKRVDKHVRITLNIDAFDVNQNKLKVTLGNALDRASDQVTFEISKFAVNDRAMRAALLRAMRRMRNGPWPPDPGGPGPNPPPGPNPDPGNGGGYGRAGGIAGMTARAYGPLIGLGLGGYGLSQLNQRNQAVISAQLTTQAVTEAAGLQGQGPEAFEWLRSQGNRIGFNYLDQAQDYNNFLSNSLGAGMGLEESQNIYQGFAEYSRAMGISPARNKLVMNALSQMMGKGTVSMEELKRQMSESMPG